VVHFFDLSPDTQELVLSELKATAPSWPASSELRAGTGFYLPTDLQWVLSLVPEIDVRPRAVPLVDRSGWLEEMHSGRLGGLPARSPHAVKPPEWGSLYDGWHDMSHQEAEVAHLRPWLEGLLFLMEADNHGDHHVSLDFAFDATNPPLVWVHGYEHEWTEPDKVQWIASSFTELLGMPLLDHELQLTPETAAMEVPEPSDRAIAWTAFRDAHIASMVEALCASGQ